MKTKYERMSNEEKKNLYKEYKKEKEAFVKKMEKMFLLCYLGIGYGLLMFLYDYFIKKNTLSFILDIVVSIFCLLALLKIISTKKSLLNKYAIEKEKKNKKEILKKYQK